MTDATHLLYDAAQHAVAEAEARVAELLAHVAAQDAVKMQATFNPFPRIVMADGSLADAAMYLAEARRRAMLAEVDDPYADPGPLPPFHKTFPQDRAGRHPADH